MKQLKLIKWVFAVLLLLMQAVVFAQDSSGQPSPDAPSDETLPATDSSDATSDGIFADTASFRAIPDSVVNQLKRNKDFAYANDPEFWKEERNRLNNDELLNPKDTWLDKLVAKTWFRRLMLALMVCLLVFAVVKIALSNRMMLRRGPRQYNLNEDDAALQKEDLDKLVAQAEQAGNFRLAVRYRYMKALQQMDARGIIQLDAKSTNWDYVNRLINHPLKKQFLLLTRAYEYVWYGEFPLNGDQYQYLKTEFGHYNNSLA
jgi:hypothetical protein